MATFAENLVIARDNIAAQLAAHVTQKPNYSTDGQSVQWQSLYDSLWNQLKEATALIAMADGGYEVKTQVFT